MVIVRGRPRECPRAAHGQDLTGHCTIPEESAALGTQFRCNRWNIGAYIINTILGVPYNNSSIMGPQTLFYLLRPLYHRALIVSLKVTLIEPFKGDLFLFIPNATWEAVVVAVVVAVVAGSSSSSSRRPSPYQPPPPTYSSNTHPLYSVFTVLSSCRNIL